MLIKAASLFTVADARGKEMDQGEMMRYLSEMMWFPSAFLEDNISFEAADATSARVTLTDHGTAATGTLFFDRGQAHRVRGTAVRGRSPRNVVGAHHRLW
jgi:hypothetical protein